MSKVLEVIVTSGGTISKIDDVRHIGNFSRGTTGALIAEEFLRNGATVHYVYGREAKRPFREGLILNPTKPFDEEVKRAKKAREEFNRYAGSLHEYGIETFEEYYKTVKMLLTKVDANVIVLAAAVSDYGTKTRAGKISSDLDTMQLELTKNPKVISLVKQWNPNIFQVGFKLLSNASIDGLIDVAYQNGIKSHSDLTVANTLIDGEFSKRAIVLITPEKGLIPVSSAELAPKLVGIVKQRISKKHYKTQADIKTNYAFADDIAAFKNYVQKLWKLNLFEPYFNDANAHFGFVAARVKKGGFLITSRASNKKGMPLEDIVYVPRVDFDTRTVHVNSYGKKASLNANVAGKIFEERPEVNIILHAHVFPGFNNKTSADYAPGTQEDIDEVMAHRKQPPIKDWGHFVFSRRSCLMSFDACRFHPHHTSVFLCT